MRTRARVDSPNCLAPSAFPPKHRLSAAQVISHSSCVALMRQAIRVKEIIPLNSTVCSTPKLRERLLLCPMPSDGQSSKTFSLSVSAEQQAVDAAPAVVLPAMHTADSSDTPAIIVHILAARGIEVDDSSGQIMSEKVVTKKSIVRKLHSGFSSPAAPDWPTQGRARSSGEQIGGHSQSPCMDKVNKRDSPVTPMVGQTVQTEHRLQEAF